MIRLHERPDVQQAPSNAQLLALALNTSEESATELLRAHGFSLRRLFMNSGKGVGLTPARVRTYEALRELFKRWSGESRDEGAPVRSPADVYAVMAPKLEDLPVEEFHVIVLDAQRRVERDLTITRGILNSSLVHPREVFRGAIQERAAAVVLVHNHPSGDPTPSADDRLVTEQLVAAGRLLDIPVHDHVIIGRGRYTSFAQAGLL